MTAKNYKTEKEKLYKKYNLKESKYSHEVLLTNNFGTVYIQSEWTPRIKLGHIHSRLDGNIEMFKKETGYDINTYNGKCNFYFNDPNDCLLELEEYINNLLYFDDNTDKQQLKKLYQLLN